MGRVIALLYGLICYVMFVATFLYSVAFVGNYPIDGLVPITIDSGTPGPLVPSILINLLLLGVFGIQHTVMARPGFKEVWTKVVPKSVERSTYVLLSNLALILLFWQWQPMPEMVWEVPGMIAYDLLTGLFFAGWFFVFISSFMINHFELFGLSQVMHNMSGREPPSMSFKVPMFYKFVRHPIMLGFVIAFWATPAMSQGHLLFAVVTTIYILVALWFEERDLMNHFGAHYVEYRQRVRMIIPLPKGKPKAD